jgi:hypothetical protein
MSAIQRALLVMVLDPKIRAFLQANDPKALEQAEKALRSIHALPCARGDDVPARVGTFGERITLAISRDRE